MPNPDVFGYKKFWGWVGRFLGKYRNKINRSKFQEKVPGYNAVLKVGPPCSWTARNRDKSTIEFRENGEWNGLVTFNIKNCRIEF